jgi:choline dehydrogenase
METRYDYIIVGAGSAGCILAARLTEDPDTTVLLVEAGGSDRKLFITMPGGLPFVYQNKRIGWGYQSGPEPHLGGKTIDEKAGKIVGGSSSINAMIYNRGNPLDYDGWAHDGLTEWSYAHCLPYFRKMETFQDGPDDWRGGDGPVHITRARAEHPLYQTFLTSGEQAGYVVTPDHNGYRQEGFHVAQSFIDNGVRWSAPRAYLRPALHRHNLHLLSDTEVTRIVIDNGTAVGIEIIESGAHRTIRTHGEVLVSAGAINTPRLLLLSGVGPADELRQVGVSVVENVPEVGRNLQNHPGVDLQFSTDDADSLTSQLHLFGRAKLAADWAVRRKGLGTTNFFETGAFLKTRDDVDFPNMQYEFLPLTRRLVNKKLVPLPGFQFWMDLSRPESRGAVTLRSNDPAVPPSTVFNHYQSAQDMHDMVDGIRLARDIVSQPAWRRIVRGELTPGANVTSTQDIKAFVRAATNTSYHPSGTCRMGADPDAVVDADGRMPAVANLRIVDASIMPKVITGNLNAPVMMMAEKIADRIRGKALAPSTAQYYASTSTPDSSISSPPCT